MKKQKLTQKIIGTGIVLTGLTLFGTSIGPVCKDIDEQFVKKYSVENRTYTENQSKNYLVKSVIGVTLPLLVGMGYIDSKKNKIK